MPDPKPDDVDFHEETTDPLVADLRDFYKVEKWTRDGFCITRSLRPALQWWPLDLTAVFVAGLSV